MHQEFINTLELNQSTFLTLKRFQLTCMAYKLIRTIVIKWYKIFGYIRADAIKQLFKYIVSVKLTELTTERAPLKIKYEAYLLVKYI